MAQRHPRRGKTIEAVWDPTLRRTMKAAGVAIAEEAVAGALILDLGCCD